MVAAVLGPLLLCCLELRLHLPQDHLAALLHLHPLVLEGVNLTLDLTRQATNAHSQHTSHDIT